MENTLRLFTESSLYDACLQMLEHLQVSVNEVTREPIPFVGLYQGTYSATLPMALQEALEKVEATYYIGNIDEATLAGNGVGKSVDEVKTDTEAGKYEGMMVFAIDVAERKSLSRQECTTLTRGFNRIASAQPVILFIRQGKFLSLATCERMAYSQEWRNGRNEKLGKVSILRNVNCEHPHRGHLDILNALGDKAYPTFDALYKHWMEVFSNELLTKKFYSELSDWYAWAVQVARFPNDLRTNEDDEKFNHEACIRLITRLIFVWFLKQKHLIPDEFFDEDYIREHFIKNFDPHGSSDMFYDSEKSNYYRLILQNLFFAMLNRPIVAEGKDSPDNRRFRSKVTGFYKNDGYNVNNLMRYENDFMPGGADEFLRLANSSVPFLNGGLFECLDDKPNKIYYDGFSENKKSLSQLYLPDYLFFGDEVGHSIDLSKWYGDRRKKNVSAQGIIDILRHYCFTVEENTPYDQEVSLDPELLGKAFENLLAAYNPETQTSARKQTGSFYTPREIVQYMVNESLVAHLKRICGEQDEPLYRQLLSYSTEDVVVSEEQSDNIMDALYHCRVLDPACGSGAFPMGILQQMVHVLKRIDPTNEKWKDFMINRAIEQSKKAFMVDSDTERKERLADIENAFNSSVNDPDYARKLYLIEHCIYGVDIQPIATQISKLRFFISLVVDQRPTTDAAHNFGIRPLPNLEAKFVSANTLIPVEYDSSLVDGAPKVMKYKEKLKELNHKIFLARRNIDKQNLKEQIKETRKALAEAIENTGFVSHGSAQQLADWDMFDQNTSSPFFDPEWMFGVKGGFDIVIANPPYVNVKRGIDKSLKALYEVYYKTAVGQYDLFVLFIEYGIKYGIINIMIVPKPILNNENYKIARRLLLSNNVFQIITGSNIFENAGVESCIFLTNKISENSSITISKYEDGNFKETNAIERSIYKNAAAYVFSTEIGCGEIELIEKLNAHNKLGAEFNIKRGVEVGKNDDCVSDIKNDYPLLRGQDISRYSKKYAGLYIDYDEESTSIFKEIDLYNNPKILLRRVGNSIQCVYDDNSFIVLNTIYCVTLKESFLPNVLEAYSAILNSKLIAFWFYKTYCNTDKLFPYIRVSQLAMIPIVNLSQGHAKTLCHYARQICKSPSELLENQIDFLVYHLYNLTYDEVLIVDPETPFSREQYESNNNLDDNER